MLCAAQAFRYTMPQKFDDRHTNIVIDSHRLACTMQRFPPFDPFGGRTGSEARAPPVRTCAGHVLTCTLLCCRLRVSAAS
jgi:hypothetical protein